MLAARLEGLDVVGDRGRVHLGLLAGGHGILVDDRHVSDVVEEALGHRRAHLGHSLDHLHLGLLELGSVPILRLGDRLHGLGEAGLAVEHSARLDLLVAIAPLLVQSGDHILEHLLDVLGITCVLAVLLILRGCVVLLRGEGWPVDGCSGHGARAARSACQGTGASESM